MSVEILRAQAYLERFGYLRSRQVENFGFSTLKTFAGFVRERGEMDGPTYEAIAAFQTYHGLEVTGTLTSETLQQMSQPRCGFPDLGEFVLQGNKWNKRDLTWTFQELTSDLPNSAVGDAIRAAFKMWSDAANLTFKESGSGADIIIRFVTGSHGDGNAFDGPGNVLAHAYFPGQGAISGDAHFDDAERWVNAGNGIDLLTVAAHEFGHSLGLAHSQTRGALMYPYYGGPMHVLHSDDVAGIRTLYGAAVPVPVPPPPPPPPEPAPPPVPPPAPPEDVWIQAARAALEWFTDENAVTAVAIAAGESAQFSDYSGDPLSIFVNRPDYPEYVRWSCDNDTSFGAWQINLRWNHHHVESCIGDATPCEMKDWLWSLFNCARVARLVYINQGWTAWSVYNTGLHARWLPQAQAAVDAVLAETPPPEPPTEPPPSPNGTITIDWPDGGHTELVFQVKE